MSDIPEHIVERVARAMCRADGWNPDYSHIKAHGEPFFNWMFFIGKARAAIEELGGERVWLALSSTGGPYKDRGVHRTKASAEKRAREVPHTGIQPALLIKLEGDEG